MSQDINSKAKDTFFRTVNYSSGKKENKGILHYVVGHNVECPYQLPYGLIQGGAFNLVRL